MMSPARGVVRDSLGTEQAAVLLLVLLYNEPKEGANALGTRSLRQEDGRSRPRCVSMLLCGQLL